MHQAETCNGDRGVPSVQAQVAKGDSPSKEGRGRGRTPKVVDRGQKERAHQHHLPRVADRTSLPVSVYSLPVSMDLLPVRAYSLPVSVYSLPVSVYSLPVSVYSVPVSVYSLPVSIYSLPVSVYSSRHNVVPHYPAPQPQKPPCLLDSQAQFVTVGLLLSTDLSLPPAL